MSRIALHWQVLIGMVLGSVVGLSLNWGWSVREVTVGQDDMPAGVLSLELVATPVDGAQQQLLPDVPTRPNTGQRAKQLLPNDPGRNPSAHHN